MNDDERDEKKDPELTTWLRRWDSPPATARLDERVKASYRSAAARASVWERLRRARVSLPVPVAALLVMLLLGMGVLAGERWPGGARPGLDTAGPASGAAAEGLANLRPLPEIRLTVLRRGAESDEGR